MRDLILSAYLEALCAKVVEEGRKPLRENGWVGDPVAAGVSPSRPVAVCNRLRESSTVKTGQQIIRPQLGPRTDPKCVVAGSLKAIRDHCICCSPKQRVVHAPRGRRCTSVKPDGV